MRGKSERALMVRRYLLARNLLRANPNASGGDIGRLLGVSARIGYTYRALVQDLADLEAEADPVAVAVPPPAPQEPKPSQKPADPFAQLFAPAVPAAVPRKRKEKPAGPYDPPKFKELK